MRSFLTPSQLTRLLTVLLLAWSQQPAAVVAAGNRASLKTEITTEIAQKHGDILLAQNKSGDLNSQAQERFERGDYPTAISLWTQFILSNPNQTSLNDALSSRAKSYLVLNQPALALADLNRISISLNQVRELANLWLLKGVALLQMRNFSDAVQAFNNSERLAKGNAILYSNRAVALQSLGKLAEAKKDLLASIALAPTMSSYYNLGVLERFSGNYTRCFSLLSEIIKKSPTYSQAYLQRGLCAAALNQHEAALADMLRVLKLDPNNVQAIEQMGISLAAAGKTEAARTYLLKASSMRLALGQTADYERILKIMAGLGTK